MEETLYLIPLRNRYKVIGYGIVDGKKYDKIRSGKWHVNKKGYIQGRIRSENFHGYLNRYVFGAKKGDPEVDHKNLIKIDNRLENLRFATKSQNQQNVNKKENTTSKYIGVSRCKKANLWLCSIRINKKQQQYRFEKENHAAYCYDILAKEHYGPGAKTNNINRKPRGFKIPEIKKRTKNGAFVTSYGKYYSEIRFDKKRYYLGVSDTEQEAIDKYNKKKKELIELKKQAIMNKPILRDENGQVIIEIFKRKKKIIECPVNEEDYYDLMQYNWMINTQKYIQATIEGRSILMHNYLMKPKDGILIDHINHITFDNRRCNLRDSDNSLNSHNKSKSENALSKYFGVTFDKTRNKYRAAITKNGQHYSIGYSDSEIEAAEKYNKKAIELYGKYANLNVF